MSFAFAGTPEFASWVLRNLVELGRRPALVITQPDRPRGRGRKVGMPPAAAEAARLGLECLQTDDVSSPPVIERLHSAGVSTVVVASFGQILRSPLLDSFLCLNVHTSLLPQYRGAAPIERAIAAGEQRVGVSIMRVTEKLDEGPVALQKELSLSLHDDTGTVRYALGVLGAVGMSQVLDSVADGTVVWVEQQGPGSYARKLTAGDCVLAVAAKAGVVNDQVRSLSPSVGARAASGDLEFKVLRSWPYGEAGSAPLPAHAEGVAGVPGRVSVQEGRFFIGCAEGAIEVLVVQPAGRGRMTAQAFLRGYRERLGESLDRVATSGECGCGE